MKTIDKFSRQLQEITSKNGALNVRLFGSMAKGTATPSSDLDLLVDLAPGRDLFDLIGMKQEIEALTGLRVDIVTERSLSKHLREKILHEARPL
ncbi:MAG: nucleotidyltransferase family protein [Desulfocapsaceae bacterium]|nr:nucleotidyltransferase family protein [Desulfocapsaceae bacterium]